MPPETMINFAVSGNNVQALGNVPSGPTGGKKDRHSKIYTAQGLRDRRVRLSIDIARKFFDLQDMLGYDKASKTLEWLFSKSRKAIKDLSRTKHFGVNSYGGAKRMSLDSDVEEEDQEEEEQGGMLSIDHNEEEKVSKKVEVFHLLSKESRAKARERTMDKKQVVENNGVEKIFGHRKSSGEEVSNCWNKHLDQNIETSTLSMQESVFMNKRKICAKKFIDDDNAKPDTEISQWKLLGQVKPSKGLLQEPSIVKRKWRPSIISGSSQTNLLISIDGLPINLTQNWDNSSSNPNYPFPK